MTMTARRYLVILLSVLLAGSLCGCEAFARKFTRKPKKENQEKEAMVLAPEEYKGSRMTKEELYRQYFLYWKSWHGELIQSLAEGKNRKKQIDCINEELKNLQQLRAMLNSDMRGRLDTYINQLKAVKSAIEADIYARGTADILERAERIQRNMFRDFEYPKVKDSLV